MTSVIPIRQLPPELGERDAGKRRAHARRQLDGGDHDGERLEFVGDILFCDEVFDEFRTHRDYRM